jgi:NADPH:quinone reductase-like Zn-dependent oxidoreductase
MRAVVFDRYGPPDVLELREVDKPVAADDEVLVRVRAASVSRGCPSACASRRDCGTYVLAGGPKTNRWIGSLGTALGRQLVSKVGNRRATTFLAKLNREDLSFLGGLLADGSLRSVIDRCYPLAQLPQAVGYVGEGHARGKVVITIGA